MAWAVSATHPSPWWLVVAVLVCAVGQYLTFPLNYALALMFVTPMALLAVQAGGAGGTVMMVRNGCWRPPGWLTCDCILLSDANPALFAQVWFPAKSKTLPWQAPLERAESRREVLRTRNRGPVHSS